MSTFSEKGLVGVIGEGLKSFGKSFIKQLEETNERALQYSKNAEGWSMDQLCYEINRLGRKESRSSKEMEMQMGYTHQLKQRLDKMSNSKLEDLYLDRIGGDWGKADDIIQERYLNQL